MLRRSSGSDPRPSLRRAEAVWTRRGSRDSPHPPTKEGPGPQKSQPVPAHRLGLLQRLLTPTCPFPPPGPAFPGETQFNSKGKLSWQSELPTSFLKKNTKSQQCVKGGEQKRAVQGMAWGGRPAPDPRRSAPGQPMLQLWTLLEHLKAGRHSCCLQGDGIGVGGGRKVVGRGPRCHPAPAGPSLGNTFPFLPPTRPHHLDAKLSLGGSTTAGPRLARTWAGWPSWTHTEGMGTAEHPTPAKAPQYPHPTRELEPQPSVSSAVKWRHLFPR